MKTLTLITLLTLAVACVTAPPQTEGVGTQNRPIGELVSPTPTEIKLKVPVTVRVTSDSGGGNYTVPTRDDRAAPAPAPASAAAPATAPAGAFGPAGGSLPLAPAVCPGEQRYATVVATSDTLALNACRDQYQHCCEESCESFGYVVVDDPVCLLDENDQDEYEELLEDRYRTTDPLWSHVCGCECKEN